jgi:LPS-assembly protein
LHNRVSHPDQPFASTMRWARLACWLLCAICLLPAAAAAQEMAGCETSKQWSIDRLGKNHIKLVGQVEVNCGEETFFADEIEMFTDEHRMIATGNVVFTSGTSRIAAERLDFNTETKTGTFYQAAGSATIREAGATTGRPGRPQQPSMFSTGQEPDVYFYGDTVQKIGEDKYRITHGGFTTCLQPNPRWQLTSGTVTLRLDHYALLTNSLFKVKGVPVLYLPIFYYPVQEDDRATGFLIPTYGASTIRGQTLSNAFFWAINRSQDVTVMHDWFSKTGQGYGGEYRYIGGAGANGFMRGYNLREHEATYSSDEGEQVSPARTSYELQGSMSQPFGRSLRARGRVDYFSSLEVQQTYYQDVFNASRRQRSFSGSLTGNWGQYNVVGSFDRSQYFYGTTSSSTRGGTPHITVSRSERPLFGPLYFSAQGDYNHMIVQRESGTTLVDQGLTRYDLFPKIRLPFTKWQWLTINSTAGFRETYWTESRDANKQQVEQGINRTYVDLQSQLTGPVLNRIWSFKESKLKHSIEPYFNIQRISAIDDFDRYVQIDYTDLIVGKTTRISYGITNRLFTKKNAGRSREMLSASIGQSYYSDARAAQYDRNYQTSNGTAPSKFSPLALLVRATPAERISVNYRTEYDTQYHAFRSMAADGTIALGSWLQSTAGWSQRRFIEGLPGFNDPSRLDHYLNGATTLRFKQNRFGGIHSFNYDVLHKSFLQQRFLAYYNAQCCGFAVEYQTWDLSRIGYSPVAQDHRLNFSFSLAGIGNFSNIFGSLGGGQNGYR